MLDPLNIGLFHHFRRFLLAAATEGLDVAPLKGAHLLTSVYPSAELRGPMADIDFLVRPRDFSRAGRLLEGMGFSRRSMPGRPVTEAEFYEAGYTLQVGRLRVSFEPHRYLIQPQRNPVNYDALWARAQPSTLDGAPCLRLAQEDHFLHSTIHLMTDRYHRPRRGLRDLELLLTRGGVDLEIVAQRSRRWRCSRPLWLALTLIEQGGVPVGRLTAALAPPLPARTLLRQLVPDPEGLRLGGVGLRLGQALLWPLLMDSPIQLGRFAAYWGGLRLRDQLALLRSGTLLC